MLLQRTVLPLMVVMLTVGCGGGQGSSGAGAERSKRQGQVSEQRRGVRSNQGQSSPSAARISSSPRLTSPTALAKRTWDDFPLDAVFFADPGVQVDQSPSIAASSPATPKPAAGNGAAADVADPLDPPNRPDTATPTNWQELLTTEQLVEEVDEIRSRLDEFMAKLEIYNGHYREVRVDAAVLGVLAGIVALEQNDVPWKRQAVHIRDVAAQFANQADGLGPANYGPAHESYVKLAPLFGGKAGSVEGLDPKPIIDMPWINVADLSRLMQRMNTALEIRVKEAVVSQGDFRAKQQQVRHEAALLAALAAVISTSYDGSEDEEYQGFAASLRQEALGLREAAAKGDFAAASQRVAAIGRSCKNCHDDYRFTDDF